MSTSYVSSDNAVQALALKVQSLDVTLKDSEVYTVSGNFVTIGA